MYGMGSRCKCSSKDASGRKRLLRVGSITQKQNRGSRNEWMHRDTGTECVAGFRKAVKQREYLHFDL